MSNISQRAALEALTGPQEAEEQMRLAFDRRRKTIVAELNAIQGVVTPTPLGAFYVYPDVSGLLGRTWGGVTPTTSLELADLILDQAEVATVPGEAFGPSGYLRLVVRARRRRAARGRPPPAAPLRLAPAATGRVESVRSGRDCPAERTQSCGTDGLGSPLRGGQRSLRSSAHAVSSWRDDSCSLRSTADTWVSTVLTEMNSSAATSLYA